MKTLLTSLILLPFIALAAPEKAKMFEGKTFKGKTYKLSKHIGKKTIVLEWLNHGCPFVKKHYGANNMQNLQKEFTKQGVHWVSIISSAEGKQGFSDKKKAKQDKKDQGAKPSTIILDTDGSIGKMYGAKTTPHVFVINKEGLIAYKGAIDSVPSTDPADIPKAKPFLKEAITRTIAMDKSGKKLTRTQSTKPYGCSVKY